MRRGYRCRYNGSEIGQTALCGMKSYLFDINADQLDRGMKTIQASYRKGLDRDKISDSAVLAAHENLVEADVLSTAIAEATLIIEAILIKWTLRKLSFGRLNLKSQTLSFLRATPAAYPSLSGEFIEGAWQVRGATLF